MVATVQKPAPAFSGPAVVDDVGGGDRAARAERGRPARVAVPGAGAGAEAAAGRGAGAAEGAGQGVRASGEEGRGEDTEEEEGGGRETT